MKNTINLLSITAKPLTFWEKFYIWALTIGRYIVIIVELIVLLAFLYKFKIDHDLSSVQSDIKANVDVYNSQSSKIVTITQYQEKIAAESQAMNNQKPSAPILRHTLSLIPSNIVVVSFDLITDTSLQINGKVTGTSATELTDIQNLATAFKNDSAYTNVSLSNVSTDQTSHVTNFNLSMDLAGSSNNTNGQ